jgi:hypothetical protein
MRPLWTSLPLSALTRPVAPWADFSERYADRCIYCERGLPEPTFLRRGEYKIEALGWRDRDEGVEYCHWTY